MDHTTWWKGIKTARKWCKKLCTLLFEVTFSFGEMWLIFLDFKSMTPHPENTRLDPIPCSESPTLTSLNEGIFLVAEGVVPPLSTQPCLLWLPRRDLGTSDFASQSSRTPSVVSKSNGWQMFQVTMPGFLSVAPGGPGYARHKSSGSRSSEASSAYSGGSDTMQVRNTYLAWYWCTSAIKLWQQTSENVL